MIFLSARNREWLKQNLSKEGVERLFLEEMQQIRGKLRVEKEVHLEFGMQKGEWVFASLVMREIAAAMLTQEGFLNWAVGPAVAQALFPDPTAEYAIGARRVIEELDWKWEDLFNEVFPPERSATRAALLIRAELGLSPSEPITAFHAKQVILAALLSQFFPGPTGDCFAIACEIKQMQRYLRQAFKDYASLAQFGSITRISEGKKIYLYFDPSLNEPDLFFQRRLINFSFLECPSLKRAFLRMGIENPESIAREATELLLTRGVANPYSLIQAFAETAKKEDKLEEGLYAFSMTQNRMLRACESAFATYPEMREGQPLRIKFIEALQKTMLPAWKELATEQKFMLRIAICKEIERNFYEKMRGKIHYIYCHSTATRVDQGGFELYERLDSEVSDPVSPGKKIYNFLSLKRLIDKVFRCTVLTYSSTKNQETLNFIQKKITAFIERSHFIGDLFRIYDPQRRRTPLVDLDVDEPLEPDSIDVAFPWLPPVQSIQPKNPHDLMSRLLKYLRSVSRFQVDLFNFLNSEISPLYFEPQFLEQFQMTREADLGPSRYLITPSQAIALNFTPEFKIETIRRFIQDIRTEIDDKFYIPFAKMIQLFANNLNLTHPNLSVRRYSNSVCDIAFHLLERKGITRELVEEFYDEALLESVPSISHICREKAVIFGALNLEESPKKFYLCFYYNFRKEAIDIGIIDEYRKELHVNEPPNQL